MLLIIATCCVALGYLTRFKLAANRQIAAVEKLTELECRAFTEIEFVSILPAETVVNGRPLMADTPLVRARHHIPAWYESFLGEKLLYQYSVLIIPSQPKFKFSDIENELKNLIYLNQLIVFKDDFDNGELERFFSDRPDLQIEYREPNQTFCLITTK